MNINELVKKCHHAAIDKGFYECPTCKGKGNGYHDETGIETCPDCRGSGINEDRNISELLMLIVSELGEAQEALRKNKHTKLKYITIDQIIDFMEQQKESAFKEFSNNIKDTFEDELADVFIRLFDLCGYLSFIFDEKFYSAMKVTVIFDVELNLSEQLFHICRVLTKFNDHGFDKKMTLYHAMQKLYNLCNYLNVDIEKHIQAKIKYNESRPEKHNKEF